MVLLSLRLASVESRAYLDPEEVRSVRNISVNYDITLRGPRMAEAARPASPRVLRIDYAFTVQYITPNAGHIRFEGTADYRDASAEPEAVLKRWGGQIPPEVHAEVGNAVLGHLAPFAMEVAQRLGLPPSFPLPALSSSKPPEAPRTEPVRETHYHQ